MRRLFAPREESEWLVRVTLQLFHLSEPAFADPQDRGNSLRSISYYCAVLSCFNPSRSGALRREGSMSTSLSSVQLHYVMRFRPAYAAEASTCFGAGFELPPVVTSIFTCFDFATSFFCKVMVRTPFS
jgi:hypothetical protein